MAKIEDICEILDSKRIPVTASDRTPGPYPYYGANGVQDYISDFIFDDELVLVAEDGGHFGDPNRPIAYRVSGKCWVNNHAHVLKPKNAVDVDYLCYALMYRDLGAIVNGATRQKLNQSDLRKLDIPLPPLSYQMEIVAKIKSTFSLMNYRKQQIAMLDQLVKSQFIEMFGDSDRNPYGIKKATWNTIFDTTTGKLDANAMVEDGQYPFFTCAKEEYKIDTYAFDCEALLLAGNNAAGVYDVKHYKGKFNAYQRTYVLQLKKESWSYLFFKHQLEQKLEFLKERSIGSNTRYLTKKILEEIEFLVPPVDAQHHYEMIAQQVDKSKFAIQQSLEQLETLKKSLMQEYFGRKPSPSPVCALVPPPPSGEA